MSNAVETKTPLQLSPIVSASSQPLNLDWRIKPETVEKMCPHLHNLEAWKSAARLVDTIIEIEIEDAQEQHRNVDLGMLLTRAIYEGIFEGLHAVRHYIVGIPGVINQTGPSHFINPEDIPDGF